MSLRIYCGLAFLFACVSRCCAKGLYVLINLVITIMFFDCVPLLGVPSFPLLSLRSRSQRICTNTRVLKSLCDREYVWEHRNMTENFSDECAPRIYENLKIIFRNGSSFKLFFINALFCKFV